MSKKLLFKGGLATGMRPYEIEDFSTLYMRDARVDEKTKAYIDSVIGNSVLNLCPYRNVLVTHKYDTVEGNVITLDDCQDNEVIQLSEVQGNTMVNCCKDGSEELILNGDIDTSGYNNVTLTEGVDGGKVDIALEGNTMVNVCDQEEPIAITKNYEVTTGNHVALQGEYDGKCRPNIYSNTLVNLALDKDAYSYKNDNIQNNRINLIHNLKAGVTYTLIRTISEFSGGVIHEAINFYDMSFYTDGKQAQDHNCQYRGNGQYVTTFTPTKDIVDMMIIIGMDNIDKDNGIYPTITISDYMILEGDYTNKPIPEYFTGMKSSFEDKLITDEKDAHNGKYKVDYKVTGKNKCRIKDGNHTNTSGGLTWTIRDNQIQVNGTSTGTSSLGMSMCYPNFINGKTYVTSTNNSNVTFYISYTDNGTKKYSGGGNKTYTHNSNYTDIIAYLQVNNSEVTFNNEAIKCQIEEGTKVTTYEPYKEYTKTLYLNSPLLEGDTIEQSGNNIIHVHRYSKVVLNGSNYVPTSEQTLSSVGNYRWRFFIPDVKNNNSTTVGLGICDKYPITSPANTWNNIEGITQNNDGHKIVLYLDKYKDGSDASKQALIKELSTSPITFIYELATPTQEVISTNDNLLLDSYVNGHLDVDSVVPIDKVMFKGNFNTSLKYLYPNTEYTIQLESNNIGKIDRLHIGGVNNDTLDVIKGINKYTITTGELSSKSIIINGIGFNASKIVVTPKVDGEFGYFKGMKSVGQNDTDGHKIEILSRNKNLFRKDLIQKGNLLGNPASLGIEIGVPNGYKRTDFIEIKPNTSYRVSMNEDIFRLEKKILFDKNKKAIKEVDNTFNSENALYLRVIFAKKTETEVEVSNEILLQHNIQIEEGNTITTHVEGKQNKKEILMNEPLRGLPNGTRDKYVIIDGKWYIERNCGEVIFDGSENWTWNALNDITFECYIDVTLNNKIGNECTQCDSLTPDYQGDYERIFLGESKSYISLNKSKAKNVNEFKAYLQQNTVKAIYQLQTPTYEPIDYNPFEVYSDITHISNNSIIPCNMVIKNTGYNCILKPNTKYTVVTNTQNSISAKIGSTKVDSTNNVFTIITPTTLTDSVLRFSGKGLTTKDIILLEGDKTNYIPGYFTGMESAFEQELATDEKDKNYGKYKVNVKVTDGNKENNITFYLKEPLRGVRDIKDKIYVKEDKVVVERNCGSRIFDGSNDENWIKYSSNYDQYHTTNRTSVFDILIKDKKIGWNTSVCNNFANIGNSNAFSMSVCTHGMYTDHLNIKTVYFDYGYDNTITLEQFRQYLQQNPIIIAYQLAEPVYEEVECDLSKLALEGYDHGTLFYDTNIPVTTQFYEFNVNIKDMLIPNETYYVTFNADRVKDITINLSGVQVNYKTSMGYNKVPIQLGDVVNTNFSMDSRGVELSDLMISTSTSLIYVKDMNDVCVYDEVNNKYSITITSTNGKESDKRVILLDYPLLRLNKDIYDRLYYSNKDSRYRIEKKVFKHKFTNDHEYSKYAAETNDTYYSSFISLNEAIKDYVVITNEKVKTVKVEDDKYYFKIKWSDLGVSDKTEANGNQGVKDFFNNNEVYLYYATDGFVEIVDGLTRQTLKVYQPETFMKFLGNTTTTVTILIPMKNV